MAFAGMQSAQDSVSVTAMLNKMTGGPYKFFQDPPAGSLLKDILTLCPVCVGGRTCKGCKHKLHSYLGEGFAGDWGLQKCHH